ncbi:MAG TPA: PHP domain-containing protein, partial [Candidatus Udaeobacter sp.]|nr:PHP domain-containing protein [Candidatus Udaeobacter sp.]
MRASAWRAVVMGLVLGGFAAGCGGRPPGAEFVRRTPWIGSGSWLKADLHAHSRFSDGIRTPREIAVQAKTYGCDVLALTDHTDRELQGASAGYFVATAELRTEFPELVILDGIEWNIPPGGGDDHAGVLVPPGPEGQRALAELKTRFDDLGQATHDEQLALEALRFLTRESAGWSVPPVVIFNHPSRKLAHSLDPLAKLRRFRAESPLLVGFEGSPGHQGRTPIGSYERAVTTIDRWDPAAARPGDLWDQLLGAGEDWWGALAFSDFHEEVADGLHDYWPGQFSETWLYVPERSAAGVLRALTAGCFFADHGAIAREVKLTVSAPGLERPAWAGEHIRVAGSTPVVARVEMLVPERDWVGEPNRID